MGIVTSPRFRWPSLANGDFGDTPLLLWSSEDHFAPSARLDNDDMLCFGGWGVREEEWTWYLQKWSFCKLYGYGFCWALTPLFTMFLVVSQKILETSIGKVVLLGLLENKRWLFLCFKHRRSVRPACYLHHHPISSHQQVGRFCWGVKEIHGFHTTGLVESPCSEYESLGPSANICSFLANLGREYCRTCK